MKDGLMYDQDHHRDVKMRLQDIMNKYNVKQVDVAKETGKWSRMTQRFDHHYFPFFIGLNHSSLSLWLQGKLKGHAVKITEAIENYLDSFMSTKPRMNAGHTSRLSLLA